MAIPKIGRQIWPAVVAHRGASSTHAENTLEAFLAAVEVGADFVELDVRRTADGQLVVMHDMDLVRTTGGTGLVHELTLAEIKGMDARVPSFEEVLREVSGRIGVDVEIKNMPGEPAFDSPREAIAEEVARLVNEVGFEGPLLVTSFSWLPIERSREIAPDLPTGFITSAAVDPWAALVYARTHGHAFVLPQAPAIYEAGPSFVEAAHEAGVLVGTWTVDDPEAVERLFGMGVDAVATNDPATAIPIRDRFRSAGDR